MKRPLVVFSVLYICGIVFAHELGSTRFAAAVAGIMAMTVAIGCKLLNCRRWILLAATAFFLLGAAVYTETERHMTEKTEYYIGKAIRVEGYVDGTPEINEYGMRFILKVKNIAIFDSDVLKNIEKIDTDETYAVNFKTQVLVSGNQSPEIRYGDYIIVTGSMTRPERQRNPGGFDNRLYLAQKRVCSIVRASGENLAMTGENKANLLIKTGYVLRDSIVDTVNRCMPAQHAALLNGMLIGYREDLGEEVEKAFRDAGLLHIMAVSGANVAFIVLPLLFVFKRFGLNKIASCSLIIAFLAVFTCVTGFEPSVVRAVIMADTVLVGRMLRRETDIYTSISFAALLMLLYNPFILFNTGFQLSYAATISLCLFYANIKKALAGVRLPVITRLAETARLSETTKLPVAARLTETIKDTLAGTLAAQLGVLPLSASYFNSISLISLFSNLVVVPLTGIITIIGLFMAFAGSVWLIPARIMGHVNYSLLSIILYTVKYSSRVPFAAVNTPRPSAFFIISYYFCLFLFIWFFPNLSVRKKYVARAASIIFSAFIAVSALKAFMPKPLKVVFIDVGNGDSIYIETPNNLRMLVDGGNGGKVIPCLLYHGTFKLDIVFATHDHADHIGGLPEVLEQIDVANLILPGHTHQPDFEILTDIAEKKGIKVHYLNAGDTIVGRGDLRIEAVHPGTDASFEGNNGSLVLRLLYGEAEILFTGDIESEAEGTILTENWDINADIMKIPHHGSRTSSTDEFLDRVNPKAAVISAGGMYGHPSLEIVDRLRVYGIQVFRTDSDGAIILETDGRKIWIKRWLSNLFAADYRL